MTKDNEDLLRVWTLIAWAEPEGSREVVKPITLNFSENGFSGSNGYDNYSGSYIIEENIVNFEVSDQESEYREALTNAQTYQINIDGRLEIVYNQGQESGVLVFESNDSISGEQGDDSLSGEGGNDNLSGGPGYNILDGSLNNNQRRGSIGLNNSRVQPEDDSIPQEKPDRDGQPVEPSEKRILEKDTPDRPSGNNPMIGGNEPPSPPSQRDAGNLLFGGEQSDRLVGGDGDDIIVGGMGNDELTGNGGRDIFAFNSALEGTDTIVDFNPEDDLISILASSFEGELTPGELLPEQFYIGVMAETAQNRVIYNPENGILSYDADGNGNLPPVELAILNGSPRLNYSNILVVV